jgi:hypothetical protein
MRDATGIVDATDAEPATFSLEVIGAASILKAILTFALVSRH